MKKIIKISILILFCTILNLNKINASSGDIDLIVSPIKYEIKVDPGDTIIREASIFNKNEKSVYVSSFSANFYSNDTTGSPSFAKDGSIPNKNTELASWISLDKNGFYVDSNKEKIVNFQIKVPENATPGSHYGALFFKYSGDKNSGVNINADYGIIILVTVSGEIIDNGTQGDIKIKVNKGGGNLNQDMKDYIKEIEKNKDNCVIDLTKSDTDGKCLDKKEITNYVNKVTKVEIKEKERINKKEEKKKNYSNKKGLEKVIFDIPFENDGNTHIKPSGKITIKDENGKNIKSVGKEYVKDNNGKIIGEKIVDYIPINESEGNVLPNTKRIFETPWEGFFSLDIDNNGEAEITNKNPGDYFGNLYSVDRDDLYPWERICQKQETKKLTAIINTKYKKYNGEEIEFNSAKEIDVNYTRKYIGYNPYFFIGIGTGFFIIILFWFFIIAKKRKKCKNCKKKLKRNMKICPYCGEKVD